MMEIPSDEELRAVSYPFGQVEVHFLASQFEMCFAHEPEIYAKGGFGSGKTKGGIYRATRLSSWYPGNKGLIGRYASTDLAATTQADCLAFWTEANLLEDFVEKGKYKIPTAVIRCIDPHSNKILKNKYSEVVFQHLDDPEHIHGHHLGWAWGDEMSQVRKAAHTKLISRLRLPGFEGLYSLFFTGNSNGHDWLWEYFFNLEALAKLSPEARRKRRAINATSYSNRFLPEDYIQNMADSYSEKMRKMYLDGSSDVFEGQIYEEFSESVHVFRMREVFPNGIPQNWNRLLAVDVGGTDPWSWLWSAVDPVGNVIVYDKIYRPGTRVVPFVMEALPKIKPYRFQAKVIDSENKLAAGELAEHGITFTNAQKMNKLDSVFRLSGYLHPNETHGYPDWHPKHGTKGSPRIFFADTVKEVIAELPQQRWRKMRGMETFENEIDPNTVNHGTDTVLYTIRELPKPTDLGKTLISNLSPELSVQGKIMNFERRFKKEQDRKNAWNAHIGGGGRWSGRRAASL